MQAIAKALKPMKKESWTRWEYAKAMVRAPDPAYIPLLDNERLDVLLGGLAWDQGEVA